jgi:YfiH family protein
VSEVEVIRVPALGAVPHGFLGRRGGVSTGELAGLNVGFGSQDDREAIEENRRRAIQAVAPGAALATVHQVHSPEAVYVETPWPQAERPHADAMVTDRPGILLGILTADCAPVLFGAVNGVTDATVAALEKLGARRDRIRAAVGPCIAQPSYEVDEGFRRRFLDTDPANERFFIAGPQGKPHFDLPAYVADRLCSAGIAEVEVSGLDTYGDPDRFYSFRRATHRGEADYGRQVSLIGLPGTSA